MSQAPLASPLRRTSSAPLLEALVDVRARTAWRGSTPGHKGGKWTSELAREHLGDCFTLDFPPDILGIDRTPSSLPPVLQARQLLAAAYGARNAWFLTQGATQGVLAALIVVARRCRRVLVQRGSHFSVFSGLALSGLEAEFIAEEIDEEFGVPLPLEPDAIARALHRMPEIGAVLLTSPGYFGAVADLAGIREVTRRAGVALVVDGSWGPHFGLARAFPSSAIAHGADVAIVSTHKHLGSLSQSAAILVGRATDITDGELHEALRLVSTTSPSHLLAASVDAARQRAVAEGDALADATLRLRRVAASELRETPFSVLEPIAAIGLWADPLRLFVDVGSSGWTGPELGDWLEREHEVIFEIANERLVGFVLGLGESSDAAGPLVAALKDAASLRAHGRVAPRPAPAPPPAGDLVMTIREAMFGERERVAVDAAEGRIAAETVAIYPPGVPLFVAGERIGRAQVDAIEQASSRGDHLYGLSDETALTVQVTATANSDPAETRRRRPTGSSDW